MKTCLGIELGSTRIKAVAIDGGFQPVSSGDYTWASRYCCRRRVRHDARLSGL